MLSRAALCIAISVPATFVLQGCGGSGTTTHAPSPHTSPAPSPSPATPAPAPTPPPTTTTTTTTTLHTRTSGWTPEEAVQAMNEMYMGFNASNDSSPLGVTVSFAGDPSAFGKNVFCHGYGPIATGCHNGGNDCRMSTAVINHLIMTQQQNDGRKVAPLMNRAVGYIFNQTLTETYFGKCAYIYDGADSLNVNRGCGASAHGAADCDDPHSAYYNMCSSDGQQTFHTCTREDPEIQTMLCKCESCSPEYGSITPPQHKNDQTCIYEMPALIVPDDTNSFTPSKTNHLRDAIKQRVAGDEITNQQQEWNEVVIDNTLLLPQIQYDPTHTIVAFVYVAGAAMGTEQAQGYATRMRDQFQETYQVSGVANIPVIELNALDDFTQTGGPFKLPSQYRVAV